MLELSRKGSIDLSGFAFTGLGPVLYAWVLFNLGTVPTLQTRARHNHRRAARPVQPDQNSCASVARSTTTTRLCCLNLGSRSSFAGQGLVPRVQVWLHRLGLHGSSGYNQTSATRHMHRYISHHGLVLCVLPNIFQDSNTISSGPQNYCSENVENRPLSDILISRLTLKSARLE